ncbi:MAG: S1 RNA-binding domain-containing protein, partial [Deltaproteobacteria bacterium]
SQIGIRRNEDDNPVGSNLQFRIIEIQDHGKSVVVSRRVLLEEERRQRLQGLRESLRIGQCVAGTITSIRDFGAFVDIGGLEGLIPAREISWDSSLPITDVLQPNDKVEVEILSLDWPKERFTFSLKRAGLDPWTKAGEHFPVGATISGTVSRLMPFGAIIRLAPGIEGLVHISRLGGRHLKHPKEALEVGQQLEVRIESVDQENRRIALLPADLSQLKLGVGKQGANEQDGSEEDVAAYLASLKAHPDSGSTMEALLRQAAEKAGRKKGTKNNKLKS